jgi:hypothetical protein
MCLSKLIPIPTPAHHPLVVLVEVAPSHGEVVVVVVEVEVVVVVEVLVGMVDALVVAVETIEARPMDRLT